MVQVSDRASINWSAIECFERRRLDVKSKDREDTTVVISSPNLPVLKEEVETALFDIHGPSGKLPNKRRVLGYLVKDANFGVTTGGLAIEMKQGTVRFLTPTAPI